jgi:hypothetical protein
LQARRRTQHGQQPLPHTGFSQQGDPMTNIVTHIGPVAALIAGILILLIPRLLN